jgi:hypothetical protein
MMGRAVRIAFAALIAAQALHSVEEYVFRLYDELAPARYVSEAVGVGRALGFAITNVALVSFGLWCWVAKVRPDRPSARLWAWLWSLLEIANGLAHLALAALAGGYFPGLYTAPLLIVIGLFLAFALTRRPA